MNLMNVRKMIEEQTAKSIRRNLEISKKRERLALEEAERKSYQCGLEIFHEIKKIIYPVPLENFEVNDSRVMFDQIHTKLWFEYKTFCDEYVFAKPFKVLIATCCCKKCKGKKFAKINSIVDLHELIKKVENHK